MKKKNPCNTLQKSVDNAFQKGGIRVAVALISNISIYKALIVQNPRPVVIGGCAIDATEYYISTVKCRINKMHEPCVHLKASKREDGRVTLHHLIFDLSQSNASYAIYTAAPLDRNYYGRPLTLRHIKFICRKENEGSMCALKSIVHSALSPLYMSNVKFYNLNVSSLVYLGYADSNFVDWKSGKAYSLECNGNSEISLPLVATHTTMENITGKHLEWPEEEVPVVLNVQKYNNLRLPGLPGRNLTEAIYGVLQEKSTLIRR